MCSSHGCYSNVPVLWSSALSLTLVLDRGGWSMPRPSRFTPCEKEPVPIVREAEWTPAPVWMDVEKSRPHRDLGPTILAHICHVSKF